ncbi:MAG: type II toxin-antitoxin system RelE/ParE family toxin [Candidatus Moeniiplasma glomeromycotorum]|nr:type II toxin-antitoxin system RelE/ParE family toxin [Candidatus Moeniiplasma glomeromycotorum]
MYRVVWTKSAQKGLKKLDFSISEKLVYKVENYLTKNPWKFGKPLVGGYKGCYRYRMGDFRMIYQVKEKELIILVLRAGHRKEIY